MASKLVVRCTINGAETHLLVEPQQTLLEVLRDQVHLTGTKEGCGNGNCGACSIIFDGRVANACLILAAQAQDAVIETVEGLADGTRLHPLQQTFLEEAALQCGICTPGFLMAAEALLRQNPRPTEEQVRHFLAGNLCRCTGYDKIVRAVLKAAQIRAESGADSDSETGVSA